VTEKEVRLLQEGKRRGEKSGEERRRGGFEVLRGSEV
jgi:hypothetical protein